MCGERGREGGAWTGWGPKGIPICMNRRLSRFTRSPSPEYVVYRVCDTRGTCCELSVWVEGEIVVWTTSGNKCSQTLSKSMYVSAHELRENPCKLYILRWVDEHCSSVDTTRMHRNCTGARAPDRSITHREVGLCPCTAVIHYGTNWCLPVSCLKSEPLDFRFVPEICTTPTTLRTPSS